MGSMTMRPGLAADLSRLLGAEGWERENPRALHWRRSAQEDGFVARDELRIWRQRDTSAPATTPAALATIQQWLAVHIDGQPNAHPASRLVGRATLRMTAATTAAAVAQPILTTLAAGRAAHLATAR